MLLLLRERVQEFGAFCEEMALLPANRARLLLLGDDRLSDNIKMWLVRRQAQHYEVGVRAVEAVLRIWVIIIPRSL